MLAGSVRPVSVVQAGLGGFSKIGSQEAEQHGEGQGWDVPSGGRSWSCRAPTDATP